MLLLYCFTVIKILNGYGNIDRIFLSHLRRIIELDDMR